VPSESQNNKENLVFTVKIIGYLTVEKYNQSMIIISSIDLYFLFVINRNSVK